MPDMLLAALYWTVEYRNFGWNLATISAATVFVVTFPEIWGIIKQNETIWKDKKGDSVSNIMFSYTLSFFLVGAIYGWHLHSVSMVFNAALTGVVQIPILVGLLKFKGFTKKEVVLGCAFALMPLIEYGGGHWGYRSELYLVFSFGLWYAFGDQLGELWRGGKRGEVDIRMFTVFLFATIAWTTFAFMGDEWPFKVSQAGISTFIVAINGLWWWLWLRDMGRLPYWLALPLQRAKGPE